MKSEDATFICSWRTHRPSFHQPLYLPFYADALCLTPRYLGTIVRAVSGRTAKEWIDRAVLTEAKLQLRHTSLSIAQVSDSLGFPNPSFFSKYFKRLTQMTPAEFRAGKA